MVNKNSWLGRVMANSRVGLDSFNTAVEGFVQQHLSHEVLGFTARVSAVAAVGGFGGYALYGVTCRVQERKPLARRWCPWWTKLTLVEKIQMEPGSDMWLFRFSFPNTFDYAGYEPVSSVMIMSSQDQWWKRKRRWYTPISHPEQRGIIEFAIKLKDPGFMSCILRKLRVGQHVWCGRWMKEYRYKKNEHEEIDFIAGGAGVSPALQLLSVIAADPDDRTRLRLLFCNLNPSATPFYQKLRTLSEQQPHRLAVRFCADTGRWPTPEDGFTGNLSSDFISRFCNPPTRVVTKDGESRVVRSQFLVSGPGPFMTYTCGRAQMLPIFQRYIAGPYLGLLRDMGYGRDQVYQFANGTAFIGTS